MPHGDRVGIGMPALFGSCGALIEACLEVRFVPAERVHARVQQQQVGGLTRVQAAVTVNAARAAASSDEESRLQEF